MPDMRKIALTLIGIFAVIAAFFGNFVPVLSAAPAGEGSPKENWKQLFADGLFRADGSEVKLNDALKGKKYVGIYTSASWCAPCKHFTPRLIEFYKEFGDQMEVVLVGWDKTQEETLKYMQSYKMPWLAADKNSDAIKGYEGRNDIRGIPNFRFYDAKTGKLLVANEIDLRIIRRVITGEKNTSAAGTNEDWKSFFKNGLTDAKGKKVEITAALKNKKYIGIYCASEDNPKCAKFTAELAAFYKKNKKKVEIVFFTYGKDKKEVLKYARKDKMPWLVMEPNPEEAQRFLIKYKVRKLPDFRIFNAAGKALSTESLDIAKASRLVK